VEKRIQSLHAPSSYGPRKVNEILNPGLSRQSPEWFHTKRSLVLQDSDRAVKVFMNPEPPVTSYEHPQVLDIEAMSPAERRKSVSTRSKARTSRSSRMNTGRWSADASLFDGSQSGSQPRLVRTQSGRLIALSQDSCELGFAFSSQSLPTLRSATPLHPSFHSPSRYAGAVRWISQSLHAGETGFGAQ